MAAKIIIFNALHVGAQIGSRRSAPFADSEPVCTLGMTDATIVPVGRCRR